MANGRAMGNGIVAVEEVDAVDGDREDAHYKPGRARILGVEHVLRPTMDTVRAESDRDSELLPRWRLLADDDRRGSDELSRLRVADERAAIALVDSERGEAIFSHGARSRTGARSAPEIRFQAAPP